MSNDPISPFQVNPPSARRLWMSVLSAVVLAALVLLVVVLTAEYGVDPTGAGQRLGLTQLAAPRAADIQLSDNLGGNEGIAAASATVPDAGKPLPLPNPAVSQLHATGPKSETVRITLPEYAQTEVKAVLAANQVIAYAWKVDKGLVYVDFHGHSPDWANQEAFVRYQEVKDGTAGASGSLVAPFAGEHGWYWLNLSEHPVVITLDISGYYQQIKNYGVHRQ
jgi:hypothetical protein